MIIPIGAGKAFDKIQHSFMDKALNQTEYKKNVPQHNNAIYNKIMANIMLNGDSFKSFSLKSGI